MVLYSIDIYIEGCLYILYSIDIYISGHGGGSIYHIHMYIDIYTCIQVCIHPPALAHTVRSRHGARPPVTSGHRRVAWTGATSAKAANLCSIPWTKQTPASINLGVPFLWVSLQ